jgi:hypothetical protein
LLVTAGCWDIWRFLFGQGFDGFTACVFPGVAARRLCDGESVKFTVMVQPNCFGVVSENNSGLFEANTRFTTRHILLKVDLVFDSVKFAGH